MAGDGVSLQTTISQLGSVAKTQLKGQQQNQQTAPLSDQLDKSKDLKVNRVKKAEKAEKGQIEPDARRKNRERKKQRQDTDSGSPKAAGTDVDPQAEEAPVDGGEVGRLVDTRV